MMRGAYTCAAVLLALAIAGCAARPTAPSPRAGADAATLRAQALALLDSDPRRAEFLLQQALAADPYDGLTHNNLGVLRLQQNRLGEAAAAFEQARLLLPGHPDPRTNLGLTFERAARFDDAAAAYRAALEASPTDLPAAQALTSLLVRTGLTERERGELAGLLRRIATHAGEEQWRTWARERLLLTTRDAPTTRPTPAPPPAQTTANTPADAPPVRP